MTAYLIKYQRRTGEMALEQFATLREATVERLKLDRRSNDPDLEIVAVASASEDHLRVSHSRYFSAVELVPSIASAQSVGTQRS